MISLVSLACVREASPYATPSNNPLSVVASYSILFTYVMAFLITAEPFALDPVTIGGILVPVNILLAIMAMVWQYHEAKRQIELERQKQALRKAAEDLAAANVVMNDQLRALDNAAVGLVVGVRTLSIGMRRVKMREKWGGKSVEEMDAAERASAAAAVGLDARGASGDVDMTRMLTQAEAADARGEKLAEWCWQEDDHKIAKYDPNTVRAPNWILYSDLIAAQLEERWQANKAAIVEIDINGKVRSATGGKAYAAETGTQYTVDFNKMTQKNMKSGFARKIRREAISADVADLDAQPGFFGGLFRATSKSAGIQLGAVPAGAQAEITIKATVPEVRHPTGRTGCPATFQVTTPDGRVVEVTTPPGARVGTVLDVKVPATGTNDVIIDLNRRDDDDGTPAFPADLMDPGPDLEPEPILLIKAGMLVQVQKKRDDGWWYGFALHDDDTDDAITTPEIPLKDMAEALKRDLLSGDDAGVYTVSSTATIVAGACKKYKIDPKGTIKDRAKAAYDTMRDKQREDSNNVGAGWFPSSFVKPATAKELSRLQALLSRSVGDAEPGNAVNEVLAPPSTWQELPEGARGAVHFVPVDPNSAEYGQVHSAFIAYLKGKANILGIERIQNRGLWQSYAVKCQTIRLREDDRRRDNLSAIPDAEIERMWFFHGSDADTLMNKISAQGFNRSFAGKNATMYGKGVYFARGSYYSARTTYSRPDAQGVQRMLMCRVAVGAYCKGIQDRLVPDEREPGSGVLFDSTVENLADPFIFVTYHDAQAYPEYIVKFNNYRHSG